MKKILPSLLLLGSGLACTGGPSENPTLSPVTAVPEIDLTQYVGTWYEIASRANRFQANCTGTTATYTLRSDGEITVQNKCFEGGLDGPVKGAEGRARVVDPSAPSQLEVTFFWPFWGDYWVIDLDPEYRFAVIGQPSREYLWILSRTPHMDEATYQGILSRLEQSQYPLDGLNKTVQAR